MLQYNEDGSLYDDGQPLPDWIDQAPTAAITVTPPSPEPAEIAAYRVARSVKHSNPLPVADDRGSPFSGPADPDRPSYIMEPDLQEAQGGMHLPPGLMQEDSGRFYYQDDPSKTVPMVRRPGLIPFANTPEGYKLVMPKLLDIVGNVMGNVAAPRVAAKAGEMVLGSGMVRQTNNPEILIRGKNAEIGHESLEQLSKPDHYYRAMTHDEYEATVGVGKGIKSNQKYSVKNEGTSFAEDLPTAESYSNFGRTDPRKTGKPTYLIEIKGPEGLVKTKDGYLKAAEEIPSDRITNVIKMENKDGAIVGKTLMSDTRNQVAAQVGHQIEHQPFYSALERTVQQAKINLATPEQWLGYLKNQPGVKSEELNHVLSELPKDGMLSKAQLEDVVKQNKVELKEKVLGGDKLPDGYKPIQLEDKTWAIQKSDGSITNKAAWREPEGAIEAFLRNDNPTKYHAYQLPGGENYKEMLLSLPPSQNEQQISKLIKRMDELSETPWNEFKKNEDAINKEYGELQAKVLKLRDDAFNNRNGEQFKAPHFDDNGTNLLAHIRHNDRKLENPAAKQAYDDYEASLRKKYGGEKSSTGGANINTINKGTDEEFAKLKEFGSKVNTKTLHLEEVQSDWHQGGRKQGYKGEKEKLEPEFNKIEKKIVDSNDETIMGQPKIEDALKLAVEKKLITKSEADTYKRYTDIENGKPVPDAPFKKTWDELVLKRMIHKAASEGYEGLSWTPGEAQAARYDLSKHLESLKTYKNDNGTFTILGKKQGHREFESLARDVTQEKLEDHVGKEIAQKIIDKHKNTKPYEPITELPEGYSLIHDSNGKKNKQEWGILPPNQSHAGSYTGKYHATEKEAINAALEKMNYERKDAYEQANSILENVDLKVGGEGMKTFYDKMLVDKANAIAKKYGSKVEQRELPKDKRDYYVEEIKLPTGRDRVERKTSYDVRFKDAQGQERFNASYPTKAEAEAKIKELNAVKGQPIHYLPITPELRAKAKEGFPLFSSVNPTLIPVDSPPEFKDKKVKLIPVQGNPFEQ